MTDTKAEKRTEELLIEIGVEELPAGYIKPALESWLLYLDKQLSELKLHLSARAMTNSYSTPRRLTLHIKGISVRQEDEVIEKVGPSVNVALNEAGELTKAGKGFLRGAQVDDFDKLRRFPGQDILRLNNSDQEVFNEDADKWLPYIKKTAKGEYIAVKKPIKGKEAHELLKEICKESLAKISFPKMMRWKEKSFRFARPIRWILALFGEEVLKFETAGVKSGNVTYGNIFENRAEEIEIDSIDEYLSLLEKHYVIADRNKRYTAIFQQVETMAKEMQGLVSDHDLLEEVTDIVEYPTAVTAEYGREYLELPTGVIHSTLAKNQRYFPIYNEKGELFNKFIYVANNHPEYAENTREGNERVVRARLADAGFYFNEDRAKSVDYFNRQLEGVVFHIKLGSVKEKVDRIVKISDYLCDKLQVDEDSKRKALRAAEICKFDLATAMIGEKEFTGLQGYMGKEYALYWGEDAEVAQAVEEHYLPVGFEGLTDYLQEALTSNYTLESKNLPTSIISQIVSLADKIDTLCSFFSIGVIPSGSKDQYGLRRAGNSIVRLIYESQLSLSLKDLVDYVLQLLEERTKSDTHKTEQALNELLRQRISQYLQKLGTAYDVIDAVLGVNCDDIIKVVNRAKALQAVRNREDFEHLMLSFKRVSNIISAETDFVDLNADVFSEDAERFLHERIKVVEKDVTGLLAGNDYKKVLEEFITLNTAIDKFFDKVLVNTDDETLRGNRYSLLNSLRKLFLNIGDLSLIVIE